MALQLQQVYRENLIREAAPDQRIIQINTVQPECLAIFQPFKKLCSSIRTCTIVNMKAQLVADRGWCSRQF
ncbi:hypothetical protein N9235_00530 [Gammaproteobacteria bacterium]|nr:hypothetical protein [Gammaproteobacteria bacterium]